MNHYLRGASFLPGYIHCQPSASLELPNFYEVSDSWDVHGLGVGKSAIASGLGEFFERRHFYNEIKSSTLGSLDYSLTGEEVDGFVTAFSQTSDQAYDEKFIRSHQFKLSRVYRISDFSQCHIPTACLSINKVNVLADDQLYPVKDTCGCSVHVAPQRSMLGALKESMERQMLARFWLTKRCNGVFDSKNLPCVIDDLSVQSIISLLSSIGELTVIDISDGLFPGVCVLVIYGTCHEDSEVKYCAGMSYGSTLREVIEKSVLELWQTFRFMQLFVASNRDLLLVKDPYLAHFLRCNTYECYCRVKDVFVHFKPSGDCAQFDFRVLLNALQVNDITGYIYFESVSSEGVDIFYSKFVSTDFFMHMENSRNINLDNGYSKRFCDKIIPSRRLVMVPFP
jgi:hypothetical protein